MQLPLFTESPNHCHRAAHCALCRAHSDDGRRFRASLTKSFSLPDDARAPDYSFACPHGVDQQRFNPPPPRRRGGPKRCGKTPRSLRPGDLLAWVICLYLRRRRVATNCVECRAWVARMNQGGWRWCWRNRRAIVNRFHAAANAQHLALPPWFPRTDRPRAAEKTS